MSGILVRLVSSKISKLFHPFKGLSVYNYVAILFNDFFYTKYTVGNSTG